MAIDNKVHFLPKFTLDSISVSPIKKFWETKLVLLSWFHKIQTIKRRLLKGVAYFVIEYSQRSCEKVLMSFLKATCICVQTGQRLLHKRTFSCGMAITVFHSIVSCKCLFPSQSMHNGSTSFCLIWFQSTIFQLNRDWSSCVEPVLS